MGPEGMGTMPASMSSVTIWPEKIRLKLCALGFLKESDPLLSRKLS